MDYNGELFLDILYRNLYNELGDSYKREEKTKEGSIREYLELIEKMHDKARNSEHKKEIVKQLYYDKYVIKKEKLPKNLSDDKKEEIINAQKARLGEWIDYLTDENTLYPMWAKYWVFREMLKIGNYDEMSGKYTKRTKETSNPFIEVNPEIIAECIDNIMELLGNRKQGGQQLRKKIGNVSFERMYIEYQKKLKGRIKTIDGRWVKYNYGNKEDAKILAKSLDGYDTKWCTAKEYVAIDQVCGRDSYPGGDFYVYYTKDKRNKYKIPRIAIRLDGHNKIGEIRGVDESQNIEEEMLDILESKLKEMDFLVPEDIEKNLLIVHDLRNLVLIKKKTINNIPLTTQEIMGLYTKKYGFGWEQDSLVNKILERRNAIKDYRSIDDHKLKVEWIGKMNSLVLLDKKGFVDDYDVALEIVRRSHWALKYVNPTINGYGKIVLEAVYQSANLLAYREYNTNSDLLRDTLEYVTPDTECYREIALEVVSKDGDLVRFFSPESEYYKEIAMLAVKTNDSAIKYIKDKKIKEELCQMFGLDDNIENSKEEINTPLVNDEKNDYHDEQNKGNEGKKTVQKLLTLKEYFINLKNNRKKR